MKLWIRLKAESTDRISREGPPELSAERPLFQTSLALDRPNKAWSMASSLASHVFVIGLLAVLPQHMSWFGYEEIDWSKYREEPAPLRLRLSQPLVFAANRPAPAPKPRHGAPAERPAASGSAVEAAAPSKAGLTVPRRLELPLPRAVAKDAPIILQPDFVPQAAPPVALPPLAFWARQAPERPKQPPRTEVVPGRTEAPSAPPKLAAPPVPAVPNRETAVAELNVSMAQLLAPHPPALPLPNSATTPVRLKEATEAQAASFDSAAGQAVNLMALSSE